MSFTLYPRSCSVQVGGIVIPADPGTGFHVTFKVKRGVHVSKTSIKPHPNTCDLKIWNLSESTRKSIEQAAATALDKAVPVVISAGYVGHRANIFNGQLRSAGTKMQDEIITELSTSDGKLALVQRVNVSLAKGTPLRAAMQTIVAALGIGPGNLVKALSLLDSNALGQQLYARGAVLKGSAADVMTDVCRTLGYDWSIQDGALSLKLVGQPLDGEAVLIDADHGMEGSPSVDTRGLLSVKTRMIPGIVPGTKLSMNSETVKGGFQVLSVETEGDNFENDWSHKIEAQPY